MSIAELKNSQHLITNAWVIEQFGLAQVTIDEVEQVVTVAPANSG